MGINEVARLIQQYPFLLPRIDDDTRHYVVAPTSSMTDSTPNDGDPFVDFISAHQQSASSSAATTPTPSRRRRLSYSTAAPAASSSSSLTTNEGGVVSSTSTLVDTLVDAVIPVPAAPPVVQVSLVPMSGIGSMAGRPPIHRRASYPPPIVNGAPQLRVPSPPSLPLSVVVTVSPATSESTPLSDSSSASKSMTSSAPTVVPTTTVEPIAGDSSPGAAVTDVGASNLESLSPSSPPVAIEESLNPIDIPSVGSALMNDDLLLATNRLDRSASAASALQKATVPVRIRKPLPPLPMKTDASLSSSTSPPTISSVTPTMVPSSSSSSSIPMVSDSKKLSKSVSYRWKLDTPEHKNKLAILEKFAKLRLNKPSLIKHCKGKGRPHSSLMKIMDNCLC
jgi:hypothetical protein